MSTSDRQVVFVQGGGGGTHDEWDDKLVASLEARLALGFVIRYPRMPNEAEPDVAAWKQAIATELADLPDGASAILVGHSLGAAILLDYLVDHLADQLADGARKPPIAGVFLIATPYIGEGGWPSAELRPTKTLAHVVAVGPPIHLYQGDDDETVPPSHVDMLASVLPHATVHRLQRRNHQLNDDLSEVAHDIQRLP